MAMAQSYHTVIRYVLKSLSILGLFGQNDGWLARGYGRRAKGTNAETQGPPARATL
jgi:hypothetical protein